jgi:hypothetical protein
VKTCKICRYGYFEEDIVSKYLQFGCLFDLRNVCENCLFKMFLKVEGFVSEMVKKG